MISVFGRIQLAVLLAFAILGPRALAAVPDSRPYTSPEIHADRSVTFRILAPKASEVTLEGGWMMVGKAVPLVRDDKGLWSVTVGPLRPTTFGYWFNVDGAVVLDQANQVIRERMETSSLSTLDVPDVAPLPWSMRDVPHGSVVQHWVKAQAYGGETRSIWVYLPPGYDSSASAKYPVLYLFHGGGELSLSWVNSGKANLIFDNLLADGKMKPMVVVMPYTGGEPPPAGPPGVGAATGPARQTRPERYVLNEIMPWSEAHYRILPGRQNRAVAGFSAGGGLASGLAFTNLDKVSQVGIFSSGLPFLKVAYPDFMAMGASPGRKLDLLWMSMGKSDFTRLDRFHANDADLTKAGIAHTARETDGAHDFEVWRWSLANFAPLLFQK